MKLLLSFCAALLLSAWATAAPAQDATAYAGAIGKINDAHAVAPDKKAAIAKAFGK